MTKNINVVKRLEAKYDKYCHYCGRRTVRSETEAFDRYPTKEHVVPRAFGGTNSFDNFVLACYKCNQARGTILFYCDCRDCREKVYDALYDKNGVNQIFEGIVRHNRPRIRVVYYENPIGKFQVRIGHHVRLFATFAEAIEFAMTGACVKDKEYINEF